MVDIVVDQRHHIVGAALAVAVDACLSGRLGIVSARPQQEQKHRSGGYGGRQSYAPRQATRTSALATATLRIGGVYLFYQFVSIHILFILRIFSLMRAMRVVTLDWLMPISRPISSVEKPSR